MKVLFDGAIDVSYGFVHVDSGVGGWDSEVDSRAGQCNGLAGAAQRGLVDLVVGTHSGTVPLRIELHRAAPRLDERWDEIVEVSCDLRGRRLLVSAFEDEVRVRRVRQHGPHRVRYSALRFDDDRERGDDESALDRYLLQLWPAPMAADVVVKQTSEGAAYWHDEARRAEPAGPTPYDQALVEAGERQREDEDERRLLEERRLRVWGGREPSAAMLRVGPVGRLAIDHRDLVERIEALPAGEQRRLALAVARAVCAADHQSSVDWSPALAALEAGRPLPAPFDDSEAVAAMMFGPAEQREVVVEARRLRPGETPPAPRIFTGVSASAAVAAAADPDPFAAVLRTIEAGSWSAADQSAYFAQIGARLG